MVSKVILRIMMATVMMFAILILPTNLAVFADAQSDIAKYTEQINENPNETENYRARGLAYLQLKNYTKAMEDLNKAIQLDSENIPAYNLRGACYAFLGDYAQARNDFTESIQITTQYLKRHPNDDEAYASRGGCYALLGDYEQAIVDLNKSLQIYPSEYVYYYLGLCYKALGDTAKANANLKKATEEGYNPSQDVFEEALLIMQKN